MSESADIVIVGGGSAGCVLAERLSADASRRVILIEAGRSDRNPLHAFSLLTGYFYRRPRDNWFFHTEPQPELGGRELFWPRGKRLGGSSIFNGMLYARGNAGDYDQWAQLGNSGWSYEDILPYFKRNERHAEGETELHGGSGLLHVSPPRVRSPLIRAFIEAGMQAGYRRINDMNGPDVAGVGYYDFHARNGRRSNSAGALLQNAKRRTNLKIIDKALVTRVTVKDGRATGVEIVREGQPLHIAASQEVVLSAGAIGTPHILMLSGIGDAGHLRDMQIDPVLNLPGVGANLIDHLDVSVRSSASQAVSLLRELRVDRIVTSVARGLVFGTGPLTESPIAAGGYFHSREGLEHPDLMGFFMPIAVTGAAVWWPFTARAREVAASHAYSVRIGPVRPASRGTVTLASPDPTRAPVIDPRYLTSASDVTTMIAGIRIVQRIFQQPAFDPFRGTEASPAPELTTDAELETYARDIAGTAYHPVGTAKMGSDRMAVVDARLRVHGIAHLRVADASIMPTIPSGNTNAPTLMVAEKAADMIAQDGRH